MKTKDVALTVIFAALYAVGVIVLAPISFYVWQVRIADALLPLSIIFGFPAAVGFGLGCVVANVYGGLGIIDVVAGPLANVIACSLAWQIGKHTTIYRRFLATLVLNLTITIIVGSYITTIYNVPLEFGLLGIFIGSIVAINILGFFIEETIRKVKVFQK